MATTEKYKKVLIAIGIALALATFSGFFMWQVSDAVADVPDNSRSDCWNDCRDKRVVQDDCLLECREKGIPNLNCQTEDCKPQADAWNQCEQDCQVINDKYRQDYDDARSQQQKIFAIGVLIIGVLATIIGIILSGKSAVSGGLIAGGIICILEGIIAYWSRMDGWLRVVALAVVLIFFIWLGLSKVKDK